MEDKRSFLAKLRNIKHIDIIIAVLVLAIVLVVYFTFFVGDKKDVIKTSNSDAEFVDKIESVISSIDGVGDAKVVINFDESIETTIAKREESVTKVDKDGITSIIESSSEPIIIRDTKGDKPLIINKSGRGIKGVIVVAKGAKDPRVKLSIIDAMATLLKINRDKIKVYDMK